MDDAQNKKARQDVEKRKIGIFSLAITLIENKLNATECKKKLNIPQ